LHGHQASGHPSPQKWQIQRYSLHHHKPFGAIGTTWLALCGEKHTTFREEGTAEDVEKPEREGQDPEI
jgi:hypothetical protein